ncbi:VOC family protein [Bradyrhizobium cenepequi]
MSRLLRACSRHPGHSAQVSKDPTLPRGIDHVGLTVPDVDTAARFFEQAFDAHAVYDVQPKGATPIAGDMTERELGLPRGAKIVHMRLLRIGNGPCLELFRIEDAAQQKAAALSDLGWTHIALYVDDIDSVSRRFQEAGGILLSAPHGLAGAESGPANRGVYGRTPWGSLVELITYPSGIHYPDEAIKRWTPSG